MLAVDQSQPLFDATLLRMPFDQYGRYRMVQEAVAAVQQALGREQLRILDVGGYYQEADETPRLPSQQFLRNHDLTVLDIVPCTLSGYVQGDGTNLTYAENSFDLVISCDTLEHIPTDLRERFIHELVRVARYGVILICPIGDFQVVLAEQILYAYIQAELHATHDQLQEHQDHGLPQLSFILRTFEETQCVCYEYPSGDLHAWLVMMLVKHYLLRFGEVSPELRYGLDELYNRSYALAERRAPAYRRLVVAAKENANDWLAAVNALLEPTVVRDAHIAPEMWRNLATQVLELLQLQMANRQEEWRVQELQCYIESQREHINNLDQIFAEHHKIIESQREHINNLDQIFAEHHKIIDDLQAYITGQRQHVANLDRIIADQQVHIQHLHLQLADREERSQWLKEQITDLEQRSNWLAGQAEHARAQLASIEQGRAIRLLRRLGL
jgi:uncharacterized coiled-coil protein SlyX/SAM-dependent methyltransferase